jgi:DNA-binding MarR family transcriptional regulator
VAGQLCLEHHTVVELADRLEKQGLLTRRISRLDKRKVLLQVTRSGHTVVGRIAGFSFSQLRDEAPALIRSLRLILQRPMRP